jgi:hypothetical protein
MFAGYGENFDRFQGTHVCWRSHHPRIRQHTGNISTTPLNDFGRAGTTIGKQGQVPGKNDVKALYRVTLPAQHVAGI